MGKRIIIFLLNIVFICMFSANYLADVYFSFGKSLQKKDFVLTAISLNPYEPSYYIYLAKLSLLSDDSASAMRYLSKAYNLNPQNLATLRNSLPVYALADTEFTDEYLDHLANNYVTDAGILTEVASYQKKLGLYEKYENTKELIYKLRPDLLNWHEELQP